MNRFLNQSPNLRASNLRVRNNLFKFNCTSAVKRFSTYSYVKLFLAPGTVFTWPCSDCKRTYSFLSTFVYEKVEFLCCSAARIENSYIFHSICLGIKRERICRYNFDINIWGFVSSDVFHLQGKVQILPYLCRIRICFDYSNFKVGTSDSCRSRNCKNRGN